MAYSQAPILSEYFYRLSAKSSPSRHSVFYFSEAAVLVMVLVDFIQARS